MYTPTEVKQLITDYHWMRRLIDHQVYEYDSTSTGQYGIESAMPKAQGGTGDKVLVRVIKNDKDRRKTQELIEKVAFIDDYEHLITNDKNYHILQLLKQGESITGIEVLMRISRKNVYTRIGEIVNVYMEIQ
ncbi:hypothetical protein phiRS7_0061 [Staphylococcus phage phiRS7]|uniref:hypothetical protein n=1 Tax=Staphylococcus phage phiRS7 TaxID=1403390 RepID=UPI0003B0C73E|nr:hypothetical protein [Staphylococcus saprophyticus]YP_008853784.1 hypothetical protein phiRS7_0061 [Staphylococcus phage phiRS7]AGW43797.1 hypothetical protein phiRS7_0061 [Staphylococcus phage phiRS7]MBN6849454.1 hypothetical protein [Staphylococcus saprophyticus]MDW3905614.1 hypothetical protein [Staphylococcus saprophyticus]MDW3949152.1 hypothetical protein [Staphylococcus saprophyticus]MDW4066488.1 hypothetical protein [Staphylococcus saprophyticus]